ncbi:MAG: PQQ-binding-like beta-propeller repeat protein [Deltaproteobacteria bacterium]|nr:PQQ-binding-like beta-propeller repeat protein [Deltaproteobacteria bacterium]
MRALSLVPLVLLLGCATTAPRDSSGPRLAVQHRQPPADPAPAPSELLALLTQHVPVGPPPALTDGRLAVPRDWKELPQSAVLWRREEGHANRHVAIGDVLLSRNHGILAFDGATGELVWERRVGRDERSYAVEGCDGVAVIFEPDGVVGVTAATGELLWSRPLERRDDTASHWTPGDAQRVGCRVVARTESGGRRLAATRAEELVAIDSRTGDTRVLARCTTADCRLRTDGALDALLVREGERAWLFDTDSTRRQPLPSRAGFVAGPPGDRTVVRERGDFGDWAAYRGGEEQWARPPATHVYGRMGDDLVLLDQEDRALVRLDLVTGRERWTLPLSNELARLLGRRDGFTMNESRLIAGSRTLPGLLLVVDLATGSPTSLQLAPGHTVRIAASQDLLFLSGHRETVAVRLDRQAPALRSLLDLETDIARSLRIVLSGDPSSGPSQGAPVHLYPSTPRAATTWLARLGSPVLPSVIPIARRGSLDRVRRVVPILAAMEPPATRVLASAIERVIDGPLTVERAELLSLVSKRWPGEPLPPSLAQVVSRVAIRWLAMLRPVLNDETEWRRCLLEQGPNTCLLGVGLDGIQNARNLLERASHSSGPLDSFRSAIANGRRWPDPCDPDTDDAITTAVLRHLFELSTSVCVYEVRADVECAPVLTLGGALEVLPPGGTESDRRWSLDPPESMPDGRASVHVETDYGRRRADFVVAEIDGHWRVVRGEMQ